MVERIDLASRHLALVRDILSRYVPGNVVWAYGSRVKGTAHARSDLDIVVFGVTLRQRYALIDALDESNIPFIIQVLSWENIPDDFKEEIEKQYFVLQEGEVGCE